MPAAQQTASRLQTPSSQTPVWLARQEAQQQLKAHAAVSRKSFALKNPTSPQHQLLAAAVPLAAKAPAFASRQEQLLAAWHMPKAQPIAG